MFSFARKLCAETVNNCLPFLKKQDNPYVKQDDKNNDDEEGKITSQLFYYSFLLTLSLFV